MKIKKRYFSTMLSDLYGRDGYQPYIVKGRTYWWNFPKDTYIGELHGQGWYRITVTLVRSGCMFYIFTDYPDAKECFCAIDSFLASSLEYAEINPEIDLKGKFENLELDKLMYSFDDKRTKVINWPNEKEIEVDEYDLYNKFGNSISYLELLLMRSE